MSALRSFWAYTNVAPVSPSFAVDAQDLDKNTLCCFPLSLVNLDGYAAAAGWFQIFDRTSTPPDQTVPLKSLNVAAAGSLASLLSSIGPITFNQGLWVAMSSTEATYTAVATNYDVWGEIEEFEGIQAASLTTAGDLTTGRDKLGVVGVGAVAKRLVQIDVVNGTGAAAWLMVSGLANTSFANGARPNFAVPLANVATVQTFKFGPNGIYIYTLDSTKVLRTAITIGVSTTGDTITLKGDNSSKLRAYYKA